MKTMEAEAGRTLPDDFASAMLREVYVDLGLADQRGHHEVVSLDGDHVVTVELVDADKREIDVETNQGSLPQGIRVYQNSVEVGTFMYDDQNFDREVALVMVQSLDL